MAIRKFLVDLDLDLNQLQNVVIDNETTDPAVGSSIAGQIYYNTTNNVIRLFDGTQWVNLGSSVVAGTSPITVTQSNVGGQTTYTVSIDNATPTTDGAMSAADKTKLDAATSTNTPSTIVERDASGLIAIQQITVTDAPTLPNHVTTKDYVDSIAQGLDVKASVRVLADSNIALDNTTTTVDGITLVDGDRVLVTGQTTASGNGIYTVSTTGAWIRTEDADEDAEVTSGLFTFVEEGTTYADGAWTLTTNDPIVVGTTSLAFSQFSGAGSIIAGDGLEKIGNQLNVDLATNSGLEFIGGELSLDTTGLGGDGLDLTNGELSLDLAPNSGLEIVGGQVQLDTTNLPGDGLSMTTGTLDVNPGTGIQIVTDTVQANSEAVLSTPLTGAVTSNTDVQGALQDLSTALDSANTSAVKDVIAGDGLKDGGLPNATGEVTLNVDLATNSGLEIVGGQLQLDTTNLAGDGIDLTSGVLSVDTGVGVEITGGELTANVDGVTIQTNLAGELEVISGVYVRKFSGNATIGGGTATNILHSLNTTDVQVETFIGNTRVDMCVDIVDGDNITLTANGANQTVRVIVTA